MFGQFSYDVQFGPNCSLNLQGFICSVSDLMSFLWSSDGPVSRHNDRLINATLPIILTGWRRSGSGRLQGPESASRRRSFPGNKQEVQEEGKRATPQCLNCFTGQISKRRSTEAFTRWIPDRLDLWPVGPPFSNISACCGELMWQLLLIMFCVPVMFSLGVHVLKSQVLTLPRILFASVTESPFKVVSENLCSCTLLLSRTRLCVCVRAHTHRRARPPDVALLSVTCQIGDLDLWTVFYTMTPDSSCLPLLLTAAYTCSLIR